MTATVHKEQQANLKKEIREIYFRKELIPAGDTKEHIRLERRLYTLRQDLERLKSPKVATKGEAAGHANGITHCHNCGKKLGETAYRWGAARYCGQKCAFWVELGVPYA
ncbi:hypothetical protein [Paenibacillus wynnii]|uniref:Uncharacterized protein n=1 Tax=Paenibacillus wynnii TaxID=268407 RepID=A0A098MEX0_9BACL|nr:hypothetical protein [Paenibacillus wynnii]KGE18477.1 hypothetical protein PWYN_03150 [Paenibacillus wynnii]KGE20588.1 hypothetical protein PWYN_15470 [Paenibacillus wynnii]